MARRERRAQRQKAREDRRRARIRARELRRMRRRRTAARSGVFVLLLALSCGIGFLVIIFMGRPYPWESVRDLSAVLQLNEALDMNEDRWDSLAMDHYRIEVEYRADEIWCGPVTIEVKDGQIAERPMTTDTNWFPRQACNDLLCTG